MNGEAAGKAWQVWIDDKKELYRQGKKKMRGCFATPTEKAV